MAIWISDYLLNKRIRNSIIYDTHSVFSLRLHQRYTVRLGRNAILALRAGCLSGYFASQAHGEAILDFWGFLLKCSRCNVGKLFLFLCVCCFVYMIHRVADFPLMSGVGLYPRDFCAGESLVS